MDKLQISTILSYFEDKNIAGTKSELLFFSGNSRIFPIHKILESYKDLRGK